MSAQRRAACRVAVGVAVSVIVLASGCVALGSRARVTTNAVVNDEAGWSMAATGTQPLLPARWLLRSHDVDGVPVDPLDDLVVALDDDGDGEGDQNVDTHRFEVRYEAPEARATIWFRLVPLDVARSRRTLSELGVIYTEQLRSRSPLDAAIAALTRGDAVGPPTGGLFIAPTTTTTGNRTTTTGGAFIPGGPSWVEVDPTARVVAGVSVLAARDTRVGGAPARQLLIEVVGIPDPATERLREAALAVGDFVVPDNVRVALTLVRLPGRYSASNPYGGIEVPLVLMVGYAAPPEQFATGLGDYQTLLGKVRVESQR